MMDTMQAMAMQNLLQPDALKNNLFPITSRYYGLDTATLKTGTDKTIVYLRRRFIPPPEQFSLLQEHTVTEGERLDNITAQYLGDPEQFWRVADANNAMNPSELTQTIGRKLRITMPVGLSGPML
jgi:hypothetical protein